MPKYLEDDLVTRAYNTGSMVGAIVNNLSIIGVVGLEKDSDLRAVIRFLDIHRVRYEYSDRLLLWVPAVGEGNTLISSFRKKYDKKVA